MALNQQEKQRLTGYLFAVLAIVLAGSSMLAFIHESTTKAVLSLPLIVFLIFLTWNNYSREQSRSV